MESFITIIPPQGPEIRIYRYEQPIIYYYPIYMFPIQKPNLIICPIHNPIPGVNIERCPVYCPKNDLFLKKS